MRIGTYIADRIDGAPLCYWRPLLGPGEGLDKRFDLWKFSPQFNWGESSLGTDQLALAILAHQSGDDGFALEWCRAFAEDVLARLNPNGFGLVAASVRTWIDHHKGPVFGRGGAKGGALNLE